MEKQETPRQKKINTVLQQEIASLLQEAIRKGSVSNLMVSITKVHVTADLSIAKIYLSVFPNDTALNYFENIKNGGCHGTSVGKVYGSTSSKSIQSSCCRH